jgi:hypothetical protein
LFIALLGATTFFLWHAQALGWPERVAFALAIAAGLYGVGRLSEGASESRESRARAGDFRVRRAPSQAPPQASP